MIDPYPGSWEYKMTEERAMQIDPGSWEWDSLSDWNKKELMRFIPIYLFKHPEFVYKYYKGYKLREVQMSLNLTNEEKNCEK